MIANITFAQIWNNPECVRGLFFREQSYDTLEELVNLLGADKNVYAFNVLTNVIEEAYSSVDDLEEDCHNLTAEELADSLGY